MGRLRLDFLLSGDARSCNRVVPFLSYHLIPQEEKKHLDASGIEPGWVITTIDGSIQLTMAFRASLWSCWIVFRGGKKVLKSKPLFWKIGKLGSEVPGKLFSSSSVSGSDFCWVCRFLGFVAFEEKSMNKNEVLWNKTQKSRNIWYHWCRASIGKVAWRKILSESWANV